MPMNRIAFLTIRRTGHHLDPDNELILELFEFYCPEHEMFQIPPEDEEKLNAVEITNPVRIQ